MPTRIPLYYVFAHAWVCGVRSPVASVLCRAMWVSSVRRRPSHHLPGGLIETEGGAHTTPRDDRRTPGSPEYTYIERG